MRTGRGRVLGVSTAILLVLLLSASSAQADYSQLGSAYIRPVGGIRVGDPVPLFHAKGLGGEDLDLASLLEYDKKVMLAFWSMYCQACVEKFNALIAIQKKYEYSGLVVISVNTDGEYRKGEQTIRDFIAEFETKNKVKVNFPVLYDETNWLALAMNINFLPTIISVDSQGKVHSIYRRFGEVSEEEIIAGIEKIVQDLFASGPEPGEPRPQ